MTLAPGVETLGELELIGHLEKRRLCHIRDCPNPLS